MKRNYRVIGIMSGTSLDGLDIVLCSFNETNDKWNYSIIKGVTIPYTEKWRTKLMQAPELSGEELTLLDHEFGIFIADSIKQEFYSEISSVDFIASHGHTIFHAPEKGYTFQIGSGSVMVSKLGLPVIYDFRALDVAKHGQGAPLVPVGDRYLFSEYDACLNIGGFSNISFDQENIRKAFDICPANIVLNEYSRKIGQSFDKGGEIGKSGTIIPPLLKQLNSLQYYSTALPKSLSREWVELHMTPILENYEANVKNILCTLYEHISLQIADEINKYNFKKTLITGGGAYNSFLIEEIRKKVSHCITIPKNLTIDFKEALIFAFLGVLRIQGQINCFASVTGASSDSVCGVLIHS